MDSSAVNPTTFRHVVAMPYPGRGHINPMMNLCKLLASKDDDLLITFVVTEEWLGLIGSEPKPDNIRFRTIPNVIPSEMVRASNIVDFMRAVFTKMEAPFQLLLDQLEPLPTLIISDTLLHWAVSVGNGRNIPVASFWIMSVYTFSFFPFIDLLVENGHVPIDLDKGEERVDYLPGIPATRVADLPRFMAISEVAEIVSCARKAQYVLFASIYELELQFVEALRPSFSSSIYTVGPAIPYFNLDQIQSDPKSTSISHNYLGWLDHQPNASVLYISMGSFLSLSSDQMDEIAAGLQLSGMRYLWVAKEIETCRLKEMCGDMGLVVPWCDQLRVLSHSSIGGFLTHCGWNSIQEALFAGVPLLTFPITGDQNPNSKQIAEDWRIGWRLKKGAENLVRREEIAQILQKFMDLESEEGKEMRRRAKEHQETCRAAITKGGSSETNINAFIRDISKSKQY